MNELTRNQIRDYEAKRADLERHGYVEVDEFAGIHRGARVHNAGERFYAARRDGTADVLAVFKKDPSAWANTYGRDDVEVIVVRTRPDNNRVGVWADYGTRLAQQQPEHAPTPSTT